MQNTMSGLLRHIDSRLAVLSSSLNDSEQQLVCAVRAEFKDISVRGDPTLIVQLGDTLGGTVKVTHYINTHISTIIDLLYAGYAPLQLKYAAVVSLAKRKLKEANKFAILKYITAIDASIDTRSIEVTMMAMLLILTVNSLLLEPLC